MLVKWIHVATELSQPPTADLHGFAAVVSALESSSVGHALRGTPVALLPPGGIPRADLPLTNLHGLTRSKHVACVLAQVSRLSRTWEQALAQHGLTETWAANRELATAGNGIYPNLLEAAKSLEPPSIPCAQCQARPVTTLAIMFFPPTLRGPALAAR